MGTDLLSTGSILAAFLAGGVALFAPCCIVFLAPSYLAAAVKNRRWRLLPLTFVFAAGLALVLVPITLGVSLIAGAIAKYHVVVYWAGGLLMIGLAGLALSGRMWSLPSALRAPDTGRADTATFFSLGVFSGVASSCCAPVLAGVMALSAIAASPLGGLVLGSAYVFGMVLPLFAMALLWDKLPKGGQSWLRATPVRLTVAGRTLRTNTVNMAVAVAFVAMGVLVIAQAYTTSMTGTYNPLTPFGQWLDGVFRLLLGWTVGVPEPLLGVALLALAALFVVVTLRDRSDGRRGTDPPEPPGKPSPNRPKRAEDRPMTQKTRQPIPQSATSRRAQVREAKRREAQVRKLRHWLFGAVAVLAVLAIGFGLWTARPTSTGDTATPAPDFTLPTTAGSEITLSSLRGRPVLLYFNEGAGCGACSQQMAAIEQDPGFAKAGVKVLPIVMNTAAEIEPDLAHYGVATPYLLDDGAVSKAYGVLGKGMHANLPGHGFVLIDAQGVQRWGAEYPSMWIEPSDLLKEVTSRLG